MKYIHRKTTASIEKYLQNFPAVAIVGPRQCGKSTLAKHITGRIEGSVYLDLENPDDLSKLGEPTLFFDQYKERLICLDEIQRVPEIFPVLRSIIDKSGKNGQFLILGSASPNLLKQSSESLAGRIIYQELTPFLISETNQTGNGKLFNNLWSRGGFPRSYLSSDDDISYKWRKSFIKTFLERDISNLGIYYPPVTMERLWQMLAHLQGQVINMSQIGNSLGVSHTMVRNYLEVLHQTFMIRILEPFSGNLKKRLIKSPKIYIRDTGILHALLNIKDFDSLFGNPVSGASWETMVIENILNSVEDFSAGFFRTSNGNEIDLILQKGNHTYAVECKLSSAPKLTAGFYNAIDDIGVSKAWIAAPVDVPYPVKENIMVAPIENIITQLQEISS
ncbi:MAG: ATP-binding protein [Bacteroidetes bacterium]|nr:ATP-binding protein [Bacteroidota bacterium]